MTLRDVIWDEVANVSPHGGASFVNLEDAFDREGLDYKGDHALAMEHIVFWGGWSEEAIDVLRQMIEEEVVYLSPANVLVYMVDGRMMNLPLVEGRHRHSSDHWQPVTVKAGPGPTEEASNGATQAAKA